MAFDPDAYLAKKTSSFDPDAYLQKTSAPVPVARPGEEQEAMDAARENYYAEKPNGEWTQKTPTNRQPDLEVPIESREKVGKTETMALAAGRGLTADFLDEIGGAIGKAVLPKRVEPGELASPEMKEAFAAQPSNYDIVRDRLRVRDEQAQEDNPGLYVTTNSLGSVAPGAAAFKGAKPAFQAAAKGGLTGLASLKGLKAGGELAARGGSLGTAMGVGSSEANTVGGVVKDGLKSGAMGAGMSAVAPAAPLLTSLAAAGNQVPTFADDSASTADKYQAALNLIFSGAGGIAGKVSNSKNATADKAAVSRANSLDLAKRNADKAIYKSETALASNQTKQQDAKIAQIRDIEKRAKAELDNKRSSHVGELKRQVVEEGKKILASKKSASQKQSALQKLAEDLKLIDEAEATIDARASGKFAAESQAQQHRLTEAEAAFARQGQEFPQHLKERRAGLDKTYLSRTDEVVGKDAQTAANEYAAQLRAESATKKEALLRKIAAAAAEPEEAPPAQDPVSLVPQSRIREMMKALNLESDADVIDVNNPLTEFRLGNKQAEAYVAPAAKFDPSAGTNPGSPKAERRRNTPSKAGAKLRATEPQELDFFGDPVQKAESPLVGRTFETVPPSDKMKSLAGREFEIKRKLDGLKNDSSTEAIEALGQKQLTAELDAQRNGYKASNGAFDWARGLLNEKLDRVGPSKSALKNPTLAAAFYKQVEQKSRTNQNLAKMLPALQAAIAANDTGAIGDITEKLLGEEPLLANFFKGSGKP